MSARAPPSFSPRTHAVRSRSHPFSALGFCQNQLGSVQRSSTSRGGWRMRCLTAGCRRLRLASSACHRSGPGASLSRPRPRMTGGPLRCQAATEPRGWPRNSPPVRWPARPVRSTLPCRCLPNERQNPPPGHFRQCRPDVLDQGQPGVQGGDRCTHCTGFCTDSGQRPRKTRRFCTWFDSAILHSTKPCVTTSYARLFCLSKWGGKGLGLPGGYLAKSTSSLGRGTMTG